MNLVKKLIAAVVSNTLTANKTNQIILEDNGNESDDMNNKFFVRNLTFRTNVTDAVSKEYWEKT